MDRIKVQTISKTLRPQSQIYIALHQCYSVDPSLSCHLSETIAGEIAVKRLLAGNRGHYSPLEVATMTLNCSGVPHSVVAQLTRHRHLSFSVQSFRYTSPTAGNDIEDIIYIRPVGFYQDRNGNKIEYTEELRNQDLALAKQLFSHYLQRVEMGFSPEHARGLLPYDYRQSFIMSLNMRALIEMLDLRLKADAQLEIQTLARLILAEFRQWSPEIANWYIKSRKIKDA